MELFTKDFINQGKSTERGGFSGQIKVFTTESSLITISTEKVELRRDIRAV